MDGVWYSAMLHWCTLGGLILRCCVFLSTQFMLNSVVFFLNLPVGARCGDSFWKNPLYNEGGPQTRQTDHPDHA